MLKFWDIGFFFILSNENSGTSELNVVSPYVGLGLEGLQHHMFKLNGFISYRLGNQS
jgi:hypothetical protein